MEKIRMLDEISINILKILQEKARIPNVEVARRVGLAPSAVLERIRKLEKKGYIDGYEVRLNPKRFARSLVAFIIVSTQKATDEKGIGKRLSEIPEIQEVHYIAGEDAFLIKVRMPDNEALGRFIQGKISCMKAIKSTRTCIVLSTYKEMARIPIEDINGFRGE